MNPDYVCITVLSKPGEAQAAFAARLSQFWTQMLREHKDEFERVYAETTDFEELNGCWSRQYLAELSVADFLEAKFKVAGVDHEPIEREELFSKYEAAPPEWMQIEH